MYSSSEEELVSTKIDGWLTEENRRPCPSELYHFNCPYTLHETDQFRFMNQLWTVGDIVSVNDPRSNKTIYAQIIKLYGNELCEKRAKIMWLVPKANTKVTDESKKVHYDTFKPSEFVHISIDSRLVPIHVLNFVMNVPNLFEYKEHIGTNYLVNTNILSHAERYAESDEDDEPKSKSKVRRLLNK
ncbi:uncharacterized protein LOC112590880 [Melanaphis sacchari]|uniref:uncharacterized protein LOC112590880 n=1 Tax=Melanaphis sacchari TaxID=742174 RepID=UPI000DC1511E|nr:uncharacterized protein LOC112590880 [Melanaphis sacchari]